MAHKAALTEYRQRLNADMRIDKAVPTSMNAISASLGRMRSAYRALSEEQRNSPFGQELLASIKQADSEIKELDATIGNHQRNVGNYVSGWNGLAMSIQQVGRELPALAYGPKVFFSAISNNLPLLADEIKRTKDRIKELKEAGEEVEPLWKQLAKGVFSWQSAMTVGITLLTLYGDKMIDWTASIFKANDAMAQTKREAQEFGDYIRKSNETWRQSVSASAGEQIAAYRKLSREYDKLGADMKAKETFVKNNHDAFHNLGFAVKTVTDAEQLLVKNTSAVVSAITARAKAAAYEQQITEATQRYIKQKTYNESTVAGGGFYRKEKAGKSYKTTGVRPKELDGMIEGVDYVTRSTDTVVQYILTEAGAAKENATRMKDAIAKKKRNDEQAEKQLQNVVDNATKGINKEVEAYNKVISGAGLAEYTDSEKPAKNTAQRITDARRKAEESVAKTLSDIQRKNERDGIAIMQDDTKKKLAQIEQDYKERIDAIEKQEKELAKANKKADLKGLNDKGLTAEQQKATNEAKELAGKQKGKSEADIRKEEVQAMRDYLKEYGTYQQQKYAITKEYAEKIEQAQNGWERENLKAQARDALKDLDAKEQEKLKDSIDWNGLFGDLQSYSVDYLQSVRSQLSDLLKDGKMSIEDMKTISGKINDIDDAISRQSGILDYIGTKRREQLRLIQEAADAQERLNAASEKEGAAATTQQSIVADIQTVLKDNGVETDDSDITSENIDNLLGQFDKTDKAFEQMKSLLAMLTTSEMDLAKAREEVQKATKEAKQAEDKAQKANKPAEKIAGWFSDASDFIKDKGIDMIPDLLDSIGLGDSGVAKFASNGLEAFNSTANSISDFMSSNYIGALKNGIDAFSSYAKAGIGIFAGQGNAAKMEAEISRLSEANKLLAESINGLRDAIKDDDSTNKKSLDAYKKAYDAEQEWEENQRKAIDARASEYSNSGHGFLGMSGKHSFNSYLNDRGSNWWGWGDFNKALSDNGFDSTVNDAQSLWNLSPEEMKILRDFAPSAWKELLNTDGESNPSELLNEYIARAGMSDMLLDDLNTKLTGYSWSGFKDSFVNMLSDLESDISDFGDNIEGILSKAILNSLINSEYQDRIDELYRMIAEAGEDDDYSEEEVNDIRKYNQKLAEDMYNDRQNLIDMGIIKPTNESSQQGGTSRTFEGASQDQMDEANGRLTALQVYQEQELGILTAQAGQFDLMNTRLDTLIATGSETRDISSEIRDMIANSYLELVQISENTGKVIAPTNEMRDYMRKWDGKIMSL